ncbi:YlbD family protein [Shouchella tritolerans]|uniref:YlbD family protein n=1 Tax=Shouchella tritolerans TaxID=2979466 RepID=UPI0021E93F65|nr:YlbD family protein [Shouchella tritolerans]
MEGKANLHPSVEEFKAFIREHPKLIKEINEGNKTLQHTYEEWTVLGSSHEHWTPYKNKDATTSSAANEKETADESANTGTEFINQLMGMVKKMNIQDLQSHLNHFSTMLSNVQGLIQTFQKPSEPVRQRESESPFSFRRD